MSISSEFRVSLVQREEGIMQSGVFSLKSEGKQEVSIVLSLCAKLWRKS